MTKIDIISGFLGAGKTTLIKKLIAEGYVGEKLVLIENEFGEIGIDGGFLQDAGVTVNEMNSGCICCSLTGDFRQALHMVAQQYHPDRIIIEPSGVGKLSEIVAAVQTAGTEEFTLGSLTTVVDATRAKLYMKNFGEFFNNQVQSANCIVLSRTGTMTEEKIAQAVALLREKNPQAVIVSTDWNQLTGRQILDAIQQKNTISTELEELLAQHFEDEECDDPDCCCHHHHEDEDDGHDHHHHHHHDEDDEHEHHHHEHDEDEDDDHDHDHEHHHHHDHEEDEEHEHHHHHDHDHDEHGHDHHHHHHHGHDADEVFQSWGIETAKKFDQAEIESVLTALEDTEKYGFIVRAKGYVPAADGSWIHFDYTPGEQDIRTGPANVAGRICVIGAGLHEDAVKELFGL
jgi:G3E family GTPase